MAAHTDPRMAILALLAEQERLCRQMIAAAEAKRAALVQGDTEALEPLVRTLAALAASAAEIERERLAQVALLIGCGDGAGVGFDDVAARFDGAARERLAGLRDGLRSALAALKQVNDGNAALVRQAMAMTRQWARLITGGLPATYSQTGAVAEAAPLRTRQAWQA